MQGPRGESSTIVGVLQHVAWKSVGERSWTLSVKPPGAEKGTPPVTTPPLALTHVSTKDTPVLRPETDSPTRHYP